MDLHGLAGLAGEGEGLRLYLGDQEWGVGGVAGDSVTLCDAEGMTVYADLDGDGDVDHISTVHGDGRFEVYSADPHRAVWGLPDFDPLCDQPNTGVACEDSSQNTPEMRQRKGSHDEQADMWIRIEHG